MSESDESNIDFVLSLNPADIRKWMSSMDENEILYALSIIECAHWKLLDEYVECEEDCYEAKKLLSELFHV